MNCAVQSCKDTGRRRRGYCDRHYRRWRLHGNPEKPDGRYKHGHARHSRTESHVSSEFLTWKAMRARCENERDPSFPRYGGRGIRICPEWHLFTRFLSDMGRKPFKGATIERIDNNGNYEPSNCRWATQKEQQRNRRNNTIVEICGVKQCLVEWLEHFNISRDIVRSRVKRGWTLEQALTQPTPNSKGQTHEKQRNLL